MQPVKQSYSQVQKSNVISLEKGKITPQAVDLEISVLGACINFKHAIAEAVQILSDQVDVFYIEKHRYVFSAMLEMFADNESIDLLTIADKLKKQKKIDLVGGEFFLIEISQKVTDKAHLEFHCRVLMQMFVKRESIKVAYDIIEKAYNDDSDIFELLGSSQKALDDTAKWLLRKKPQDFNSAVDAFLEKSENPEPGIPSKFTKLNIKTNGYHGGDLEIVAGRPGMGKTALVLNEAKFQAHQGVPVGFLSLEMTTNQLVGRMVAEEYGIDSDRIKFNQLTDSEKEVISKESVKLKSLPIQIHDQSSISIMDAKTVIGEWVRQHKVKIVYIDYLQLMEAYGNSKSGNREQEISYISRTLKGIAKEFDICVVALSQLSRAVETRGGTKRAQLSDLRESGAIEQDADVVKFLYRPEYYKIDEWDDDGRTPTANQCEINIAKIREGRPGACIVSCNLKYMRFEDLEDSWSNDNPFIETKPEPKDAFNVSDPQSEFNLKENEDDDFPF